MQQCFNSRAGVLLATIAEKLEPKEVIMKKVHFLLIVLISLLVIHIGNFCALAGGPLRCSGKIIRVGDTDDYVLDQCGDPTSMEERRGRSATGFFHTHPMSHEEFRYIMREIHVEVWTYNFGSTQFIRYLTFRNGRLVDIRTGDRGY